MVPQWPENNLTLVVGIYPRLAALTCEGTVQEGVSESPYTLDSFHDSLELFMFSHILIPTDGSDASRRALEKGVELAKALGSSVTLMTAVEQYPGAVRAASAQATANPMHEAAREAALHWLNEAQASVAHLGVPIQCRVGEHQSIYQSILAAADAIGADLIVMGTHGAGALERWLVGSQTQRVLAHTKIPVLVLH